jgi:hypothetical protein
MRVLGLELTRSRGSRVVYGLEQSADRRSSWTLPLDGSAILQGEGVRAFARLASAEKDLRCHHVRISTIGAPMRPFGSVRTAARS